MSLMTGFTMASVTFVDMLQTWESYGLFSHFLPFLLIFALVFGILTKSQILGENKGVITIISITIGLLSLQYNLVPEFFAQITPALGVGMIVLLVALVLMGLFVDWEEDKWGRYVFFGIGAIIALIVILSSLAGNNWQFGWWWDSYGSAVILLVLLALAFGIAILGSKKKAKSS
jgi:hypothetical protein